MHQNFSSASASIVCTLALCDFQHMNLSLSILQKWTNNSCFSIFLRTMAIFRPWPSDHWHFAVGKSSINTDFQVSTLFLIRSNSGFGKKRNIREIISTFMCFGNMMAQMQTYLITDLVYSHELNVIKMYIHTHAHTQIML